MISYLTILDLGFGNAIIVYTSKYLAKNDKENEKIKELVNNNAKLIDVNLMTLSMDDDYFSTMTSFIENVKTSLS